jgi:type III secretory pathway component EscV
VQVFLSHSSADAALARRLARDLQGANIDVWLDEWEIRVGENFAEKLEHALEQVDFVIVLLTRASVASEWVDREWRHKLQHETVAKRIAVIPVRGEPCEIPDFLAQRSHADISGGSYVLGFSHLLTILGHHSGDDRIAPPEAPFDRYQTSDMWWIVTPIALEVSADLIPLFEPDADGHNRVFDELAPQMRERLQEAFGFSFPGVRIRGNDTDLPPATAVIMIDEVPERTLRLSGDGDAATEVFTALHDVVRSLARWCVDIDTTRQLVDSVAATSPELVERAVPGAVSWFELTDVLRHLVDEGIGVADIRTILAAVASDAARARGGDTTARTEVVRQALAPQITARFLGDGSVLQALRLDPDIEAAVGKALQPTGLGAYFALAPDLAHDIVAAVRDTVQRAGGLATNVPLVVSQPDIRPYVRRLVSLEFPELRVLSEREVAGATVDTLACVTLRGIDAT